MSTQINYVITWTDEDDQFQVDHNESSRIADEIADYLRDNDCRNVQVTPITVVI